MAKIIYFMKIFLFRKQLKLDNDVQKKLAQFNVFVAKNYIESWFQSSSAALAPHSDLKLMQCLAKYEKTDYEIKGYFFF